MIARAIAITLAVLAISGCQILGKNPQAPSLPPVFGARITDGQLHFWTGTPCTQVSRVAIAFSPGGAQLVLKPPANEWAQLEFLTLDGPNPGLNVAQSLPGGFDWHTAKTVDLWMTAQEGAGSTPTNIADIIAGSPEHPDDTYYFQGFGWLNPAQISAMNRKQLLTICTPDPAKQPSLPTAFGVRVTAGRLQVWSGSPCADTTGVTLVFRADPAKPAHTDFSMATTSNDGTVTFEHYTLGDPVPGFEIRDALPTGFDWHEQQELTLAVHTTERHWDPTTTLAEAIHHSGDHPDDTYWFQGIGWLNPTQVAEQDGKTFLATCTREPKK